VQEKSGQNPETHAAPGVMWTTTRRYLSSAWIFWFLLVMRVIGCYVGWFSRYDMY